MLVETLLRLTAQGYRIAIRQKDGPKLLLGIIKEDGGHIYSDTIPLEEVTEATISYKLEQLAEHYE
jgi:hypothetical protein